MNATSPSMPRPELLKVADVVSREKGIDQEDIFEAMEMAIQKAALSRYGQDLDIRASINRKTGEVSLHRYREVVEKVDHDATEISLDDLKNKNSDMPIGEHFKEPLPPVDMGRISAQAAKQVIIQRVREAERERQFNEFKDRVDTIASGTVKRSDFNSVTIDLGKAEACLRRDECLPKENFRLGDRVRAYIRDVKSEPRGPQIFLSRVHPQFMAKLFEQEVPEIYDGLIEIKGVARDPGSRAKLGVYSADPSIDPVGSCVGMRGSRVQAIVNELQGEKIDIVPWSHDIGTLAVKALKPVEVIKVIVDEVEKTLDVVVPDDQLSIAIGRRGQNVRLASNLLNWHINILTEKQETERRQAEMLTLTKTFQESLDVDDVIAHLLVSEGFSSLNELAFTETAELSSIDGFDEEIALEIQNRAKNFIDSLEQESEKELKKFKIEDTLLSFPELSNELLLLLAKNDVITLEGLSDLSTDELQDILKPAKLKSLEINAIQNLILKAREKAGWFDEESDTKHQ